MPRNTIELDANLRELLLRDLSYDAVTGEFRWKVTRGRCIAGAIAGKVALNGYRYIGLGGRLYLAHRLAWLYVHGDQPPAQLDHVDRDKLNNAIANLRLADYSKNVGNTGVWRTNSSGFRGVSWDKSHGFWAAYIWRLNRKVHLGYFGTAEEAANAYDRAAAAHFGDFASLNHANAA